MVLYQKCMLSPWSKSPLVTPFLSFPAGFQSGRCPNFDMKDTRKKVLGIGELLERILLPHKNGHMRGDPLCLSSILPWGLSGKNGCVTAILPPWRESEKCSREADLDTWHCWTVHLTNPKTVYFRFLLHEKIATTFKPFFGNSVTCIWEHSKLECSSSF